MQHVLFTESAQYDAALLIKTTALNRSKLLEHYVRPLEQRSISQDRILAFDVPYNGKNPCKVSEQKEYLSNLVQGLIGLGVHTLLIADSAYFKTITGVKKAEPHLGYVVPCTLKGAEGMNAILIPNYQQLFYDPKIQTKVDRGLDTLADHLKGTYRVPGQNIIHSEFYPVNDLIADALNQLYQYPELTLDIEAFSLHFWKAGIGTVGFAWDEHNGIAFPVDYVEAHKVAEVYNLLRLKLPIEPGEDPVVYTQRRKEAMAAYHGVQIDNPVVKKLLREFLETYQGKLTLHNANFDLKILVYELWMESLLDEKGKQKGIEILTRLFDDTKLITYLATNSTSGNKLSLKEQAAEFAGNYAQNDEDIKDIRRIPLDQLLRYNLVDCLSTWFVKKKHYPTMVNDQQLDVYETIFKPSVKVILQMELTGMPLSMKKVNEAEKVLKAEAEAQRLILSQSPLIKQLEDLLTARAWEKDYTDRRDKAKNPDKILKKDWDTFPRVTFNPGSNLQVQALLYELHNLPVIDRTKNKQPAVGGKTLKKLINHTQDQQLIDVIQALRAFADADKILTTFIKAFKENSVQKEDGWWYLHGNFNLGGTVSGRLSSSGPNLQNIPSNSKHAKLIKAAFVAPPGWLFCGADFASLEDRISALTTKDPNKLKVYTDGYDGHCLRAYYYFSDQMPDIDPNSVSSINSIETKYKPLRQDSKTPTFLLTYQGTYIGIMQQLGWSEQKARSIESAYHDMYRVSDEWVQGKLDQAAKDGYVTVAFGLRVRTPLLKQSLMGSSRTPYEAQAEGRTAGNALGQSYGMLNNRAAIEFQERTLASEYRYEILPCAHIHDAQYFMIRDYAAPIKWTNDNLPECMQWQKLPEIQHPQVGLGGDLSVFYPDWANDISLPNGASEEEIISICKQGMEKVA
ncbi:DNA polymerase [Marinobacterium litorale]|uniref:DNA polymerase n=1 Tax=Marinobacterium litorale TaxID=404770 RepID=UPI0003FA0C35|nr:DNA polymerase [Marinobacterium litorale]